MVNEVAHAAADVTVEDHGTVVLLVLNTAAAIEFVEQNVSTEAWQWIGPHAVAVETRYAGDLITGMVEDGLAVAS